MENCQPPPPLKKEWWAYRNTYHNMVEDNPVVKYLRERERVRERENLRYQKLWIHAERGQKST
jgi:hypothetical protein